MNFNYIESEKFKSNSYLVAISVPSEKTTTLNILSQVLKKGTENFRSQAQIDKELQDMYGATIDIAVTKRGSKTFLVFYGTYLKQRFTFNNENLFLRSIDLLSEILYRPILENNMFKKTIIDIEKQNLERYLHSEYDDKKTYSNNRALEELVGVPFSIPEYGLLSDLENINEKEVTNLYFEILKGNAISYFSGNDNPEDYEEYILRKLPILGNDSFKEDIEIYKENKFKADLIEQMDVSQAKLTMIFNANSNIKKEKYYAGLVFNQLYGGGATSILFDEIREKRSLAYYVASGIDFFTGIMTVIMGVDESKVEEAMELTHRFLKEMQEGNFDEKKMEFAKRNILKGKKQIQDSQFSTSMTRITSYIYDYDNSYDEAKERLKEINKQDIMDFAKQINYIGSFTLKKGDK